MAERNTMRFVVDVSVPKGRELEALRSLVEGAMQTESMREAGMGLDYLKVMTWRDREPRA